MRGINVVPMSRRAMDFMRKQNVAWAMSSGDAEDFDDAMKTRLITRKTPNTRVMRDDTPTERDGKRL
jgi:hypothetical protein